MKNYKQLLFGALLLLFGGTLCAQNTKDTLNIEGHADCISRLSIETRKTIGPTTSPKGHGEVLEFSQNGRESLHFMERENNSIWYEFTTKAKGNLIFEIMPLDSLNDYDFALYKYTDDNFCADVQNKKILPVRTNFSRNKPEISSKTGLKSTSEQALISAGIKAAYSQAIVVDAKETYVLLVNNVYDNGKGHVLHFDYTVKVDLTGQVVAIEGEGNMEANITLTNIRTGLIVAETTSDSMTGAYKLVFDLPKTELNDQIHLEVLKEDYFFYDTVIIGFDMATKMKDIKLKKPIRKLKKGDSFVLNNILFSPNTSMPMPYSLPTIKALYKIMKRNKKLKISIEGHTNGCIGKENYAQKLSFARAGRVQHILMKNEIDSERLNSIGYGCTKMLYEKYGPLAELNRRVEIRIIEF